MVARGAARAGEAVAEGTRKRANEVMTVLELEEEEKESRAMPKHDDQKMTPNPISTRLMYLWRPDSG